MNDLHYIDEELNIILHETFTSVINAYLKDFIIIETEDKTEEEIEEEIQNKINEIIDIDHLDNETSEQKEVMFRFNIVSVSTDEIYQEISNFYNIEVEINLINNLNINSKNSENFKIISAIVWKFSELMYFNDISKRLKTDEKITKNVKFVANKINQFSFEKDTRSFTINYRVNIN